jgi:hypothetical protein
MKTKYFSLLLLLPIMVNCHRAEEAANKTGQLVGKGATEFVNGVGEGIDKTLQCKIDISEGLAQAGLKSGKFMVSDSVLTAYLIFDKDFNQAIKVKVLDKTGQEYGRTSLLIQGKKDSAQYFDFKFDGRTKIESKSDFRME